MGVDRGRAFRRQAAIDARLQIGLADRRGGG
jgi:hypothetical protein